MRFVVDHNSVEQNPRTDEGTKVPIPVRPDLNAEISQVKESKFKRTISFLY